MDPLSVTASVIAVIQLTGSVISAVYNYRTGVKNAPEDAARIVQDLTGLSQTLEQILRLIEKEKLASAVVTRLPAVSGLTNPNGPLETCQRVLGELKKSLVPEQGWRATKKALMWPLKRDHVKAVLAEIVTAKSSLNLALAVDQTALTLEVKDGIEALSASLESHRLEEKTRQRLSFLRTTDPTRNHLAACKRHQEGTGIWFLTSKAYLRWAETSDSFLWISGIPGCGKTVMCGMIIEDLFNLHDKSQSTAVAYYYFAFSNKLEQQFDNLIRSLIFQLSCRCPNLPRSVQSFSPRWQAEISSSDLVNALKDLILSYENVYIVIDALDECEQSEELVQWIKKLTTLDNGGLHLMVSSRQDRRLHDFIEPSQMPQLAFTEDDFRADIQFYVQNQLTTDLRMKKWASDVKAEIQKSLVANSGGLFRWVDCQLDVLRKCIRVNDIRTKLATPPKSLHEMYDQIVANIDEAYLEDTCKMLQWLTFSTRPLRITELNDALAFNTSDSDDPTFDPQLRLPILEDILELCSSLVTVSKPGVNRQANANTELLEARLAHNSVKDYLVSQHLRQGPHARLFLEDKLANSILAKCCLSYLQQFETYLGTEELRDFPLAQYAAESWIDHYRRAGDTEAPAIDQLARQLLTSTVVFEYCCAFWDPGKPTAGMDLNKEKFPSPLFYAAIAGLPRMIAPLLEEGFAHNEANTGYKVFSAMAAAASRNHGDVVRVLLAAGASPDGGEDEYVFSCPMAAAAAEGHDGIVKLLIEADANINKRGEWGQGPPLYEAVKHRHLSTTKLLVDAGANVGAFAGMSGVVWAVQLAAQRNDRELIDVLFPKTDDFVAGRCLDALALSGNRELFEVLIGTPRGKDIGLLHAARAGWDDLVQKMIDDATPVHVGNDNEGRILSQAAASGSLETMQTVYENMADTDLSADELNKATASAIGRGHSLIAQYLLDRGADPNSGTCQVALARAITTGHLSTVQVLLNAGADADSCPRLFSYQDPKPYIWAAVEGLRPNIVRLLLSFGADVNADHGGRSLLSKSIELANEEIVNLLLDHGVSTAAGAVKGQIFYDTLALPIHCAASAGNLEIMRRLLTLISDVNEALIPDGWTAIFHAAKAGHVQVLELLIEHGADVRRSANKGTIAIHTAAYHDSPDCIAVFLDAGVDIDVRGRLGRTSLHWAVQEGSINAVHLLLSRGANVSIADEQSSTTALDMAKEKVLDTRRRKKEDDQYNVEPGDENCEQVLQALEDHVADLSIESSESVDGESQ